MKYLVFSFILLGYILIFACKTQRKIVFEKNNLCCKDAIVTPSMYLSSRIPDCNMAIRYMDSVIIPISLSIPNNILEIENKNKIPATIEGNFKIKCDSIDMFNTKKYLYYLNAECFEGRICTDIFNLFCPDNQLELINKIDSIHSSAEKKWKLVMFAHGGFGVSFDIQGKNVISSKTWKSYSESH